jgi:protein ImuB
VFEEVAILVHSLVPGVELLRPGLLLCPAVYASRYHGSDEALMEHLLTEVAANTGVESWVGVADGLLAAILAARDGLAIPPGESPDYLAGRPLRDLGVALQGTAHGEDLDVLMDLLGRLGIRTLGDFASLPTHNVTERFGSLGVWAQRLVRAEDVVPQAGHRLPQEFNTWVDLDPPLNRLELVQPVAARLAEELHTMLVAHGQTYDRLRIRATTETCEQLERTWRLEGVDSNGVADRVRWQLEGWLNGRSGLAPSGPLTRLMLEAEEVHPAGVGSTRLWGAGSNHAAVRAVRGADRVHTILGGQGVYQPVAQGGRDPRERIRLVGWGDETIPLRPSDRPWPGAIPDPPPSLVPAQPPAVELTDPQGQAIEVNSALELSGCPTRLGRNRIKGWAGPWPVVEQWWSRQAKRCVYLQVQVEADNRERAALLACEGGRWRLEGLYD